jgi:sugar diacid utilization regulator
VHTGAARDEALHAIGARVESRSVELAQQIVRRCRDEILDYQVGEDGDPLFEEAVEFARGNLDWLVAGLDRVELLTDEERERVRETAARRVHEGVALESFQQAMRTWGELTWECVLEEARVERADEREAALEMTGRIWRLVDRISSTAANAFLDEISDRGLLRREALEGLLAGNGGSEWLRRLATTAHITLGDHYVVVIVRAAGAPVAEGRQHPLAARVALDRIVGVARHRMRPAAGSAILGFRQGDLVVLYPVRAPDDLGAVADDCRAVASALAGIRVSIGMSGWHPGLEALTDAYGEAREAADIAAAVGIGDRAVALEDLLVDHLLRSSGHARRILEQMLQPLIDYDRDHQAELVPTLRAYLAADMNLTRSADALIVHANTVAYRLKRIGALSGRNPQDIDDLLLLFLSLKLAELSSSRA